MTLQELLDSIESARIIMIQYDRKVPDYVSMNSNTKMKIAKPEIFHMEILIDDKLANDEFEVYEGLTHLKLQKLLYFAQGLSLAINDDIIFSDKIEAWEHGPVIKSVYNEFSKKGRKEITLDDAPSNIDIINKIESDSNVKTILNLTYDNFAIYTAWQLRNLTHQKGSPWYQVYFPGKNKEIYPNLIKDYFKTNVVE